MESRYSPNSTFKEAFKEADLIDRKNSGVSHPIFYLKNRKPNSPIYIERNYLQIYRPESLNLAPFSPHGVSQSVFDNTKKAKS
jgi:hypothetical protein